MTGPHPRLGIECLSVFGMPPVDYVELASGLAIGHIGLALEPIIAFNPHGYPDWSLRTDAGLRRDFKAALHDMGVAISVGEGFFGRDGSDMRDYAGDLDIMADLGVGRVNMLSFDSDLGRCIDQFARFAEMASARGLVSVIEFMPHYVVRDLATTAELIGRIGNPDLAILVDAMHFFRSGGSPSDLAAVDPRLIGYAQLCDVPRICPFETYSYEARFERLPPGEGELPIAEFLAAVPRDLVIGLEIPQRVRAEAGVGPYDRIAPAVATASAMLAALDRQAGGCANR